MQELKAQHPGPKTISGVEYPLPAAEADTRGVPQTGNKPEHIAGATTETEMAYGAHQNLPNEVVLNWGHPSTANGVDMATVNAKTGDVTFWDAKQSGAPGKVQTSPTFTNPESMAAATDKAIEMINDYPTLPPEIKQKANTNLQTGKYNTVTQGFGALGGQKVEKNSKESTSPRGTLHELFAERGARLFPREST